MMTLAELANVVGGILCGVNRPFGNVSIDTRSLEHSDLYIALKGDSFDGHDFVEAAVQNGAAAVMVQHEVDAAIPAILVENTLVALQKLAIDWRKRFNIPVIAVTGSCGKTTTRALLEAIFSQQGKTVASEKSFNNHIGVPLTILKIRDEDQFAILEMGMNHAGEITPLSIMAEPTVAIITCVAPVHLEALGSLENIAKAKAEIFEGLKEDGTAVINNDDDFAEYFKKIVKNKKQLTFGINNLADVTAKNIHLDERRHSHFTLCTKQGEIEIQLALLGEHNIYNALAAAAGAVTQNISLEKIKAGLESVTEIDRRLLELRGLNGAVIIDDSYNANPASVRAAIDILSSRGGESILVLGDMLELGEQKNFYHQQIGQLAQQSGIAHLFCYGDLSRFAAESFGTNAYHFSEQSDLLAALKPLLKAQSTVLVKGSNGMKMNNIVKALVE